MQHTIPVTELMQQIGPQAEVMADAISACVHCGFCLPVCPTYQILGEEMNSPRGRILLMKSVLESQLTVQDAIPYIDRCLGCLGCVTACPSGVRYGELVGSYRAYAQRVDGHSSVKRLQRSLVQATLPYPGRFRTAAKLGKLAKPLRGLLPEEFGGMLSMLPDRLPPAIKLPEFTPAQGQRRARVALLTGCVQQVLAPDINRVTLQVLARNGVDVVVPQGQVCCGALQMHTGDEHRARSLARQNMAIFPKDVDAILTNAAGCGSGMKEYGLLFRGLKDADMAGDFSSRVQDISQFLANLGLLAPPALPTSLKVAYHDACHLAHAQGVTSAPRQLLAAIPNLILLEIPDGSTCCGSAGTYNLEQPELAGELGQRKAYNILDSGAEAVVMGNIGCMVQIQNHLQALGKMLPVFHTLELLELAYAQAD